MIHTYINNIIFSYSSGYLFYCDAAAAYWAIPSMTTVVVFTLEVNQCHYVLDVTIT